MLIVQMEFVLGLSRLQPKPEPQQKLQPDLQDVRLLVLVVYVQTAVQLILVFKVTVLYRHQPLPEPELQPKPEPRHPDVLKLE